MAKLKPGVIGKSDLLEYLQDYSDFSFELRVLKLLVDAGFECEHGGSYTDPATKKTREFDIRATKCFGGKQYLRLAVECKNLRENFPLLVSCVPRTSAEAFHEICISVDPDEVELEPRPSYYSRGMLRRSKNIRLTGNRTFYRELDPVGKSRDQIGRNQNGDIIANDSDVYEKWSQALASAVDLTYLACSDGEERTGDCALSLVFPLLIVPNGRLWITEYDAHGNRTRDPYSANSCSYFVNLSYSHDGAIRGEKLTISHLDFVTVDGLLAFVDDLGGDDSRVATTFPLEHVLETIQDDMSD
jgi:hypothetical protein